MSSDAEPESCGGAKVRISSINHQPLLRAFLANDLGLLSLAQSFNLSLADLQSWLHSVRTQQDLVALSELSAAREQALITQTRPLAITALATSIVVPTNLESEDRQPTHADLEAARKAATALLKLNPSLAASPSYEPRPSGSGHNQSLVGQASRLSSASTNKHAFSPTSRKRQRPVSLPPHTRADNAQSNPSSPAKCLGSQRPRIGLTEATQSPSSSCSQSSLLIPNSVSDRFKAATNSNSRSRSRSMHHTRYASQKLALAASALALSTQAHAQPINENLKILAADTTTGDFFGNPIATFGGFAAIAAPQDDDNGLDSGSAYLFNLSIDTQFGAQVHKFLPIDGAAGDRFGRSIDFDYAGCGPPLCVINLAQPNGIVVVGANGHDGIDSDSGAAYIFSASTGNQTHKLVPNDTAKFDFFGDSVATDAVRVAVGAQGSNGVSLDSGAVYLFAAGNGVQLQKLIATDGQTNDFFGRSVDIDGGFVVVGADGDDDLGDRSGSAYLFNASTGVQLHKLLPNDGAPFDHFGNSVAIGNGIVVIGSFGDDDNGSLSGSAYLFDAFTGQQLAKLLPNDGGVNQLFGISVAIDNGVVLVGASMDNDNGSNSGSAYLFNAATALQTKKLLPSDGMAFEQFGTSVAIHDKIVAVGAPKDNDRGSLSGSAYIFDTNCPADLNGDGFVDNGDIGAFIMLFLAQSPLADFNGDGFIDNGDIAAFIAAFLAGC